MSIVINTPNGNIGRPLVQRLLEAGQAVTIISRNPSKVADLVKRGARVVEGSTDDAAVLDRALEGAKALFWLTPSPERPDFLEATAALSLRVARQAKAHGVKRVVVLSSVGAQNGPGTGPVGALLSVEEAFKAAIPDVTILRPGYFMENLLRDLGSLVKAGSLFLPIPGERKVPMVATADIAAKAAEVLLDATWTGHHYLGIHGPADLSYNDVASVLSESLGRPVQYVQVSLDDLRNALTGAGLPGFMVDMYVDLYAAVASGGMAPAEPRSAQTTTPTPLSTWARNVLKPIVEQAASAAA